MGGKRWDDNVRTQKMSDREVLLTATKAILQRTGNQPTVGNIAQILPNRSRTAITAELNRCAVARKGLLFGIDTIESMKARRRDMAAMDFKLVPGDADYSNPQAYVTGSPLSAILDYEFELEQHDPWEQDWKNCIGEIKSALADKEVTVAELTDLLNRFTQKDYKESTVKRYLGGGKGFENGPPRSFKEFLVAVYRVRHSLWPMMHGC